MQESYRRGLQGKVAVVTGASGFVGSQLSLALKSCGVIVLGHDKQEPRACDRAAFKEFQQVNVAMSPVTDPRIKSDYQIADYIFHCAAADQETCQGSPHHCWDNVCMPTSILHAVEGSGFLQKIVNISSVSVYGDQAGLLSEYSPCMPNNDYARTKFASEALFMNTSQPVVTLRLSNVYGPGMVLDSPRAGVIGKLVQHARKGTQFCQTMNGTTERTYTHIDSVVEAILLAAVKDTRGLILNIGDCYLSLSAVQAYVEMVYRKGIYARLAAPRAIDTVKSRRIDSSLAKEVLGWTPKSSLELASLMEWAEKNYPLSPVMPDAQSADARS